MGVIKKIEKDYLELGDGIDLDKEGILHYFGPVHFSDNVMFVFEYLLDGADGKTNGTVEGQKYFKCPEKKDYF